MLSWSPTVGEILKEERAPPRSVYTFSKYLLNADRNKKRPSDSINKMLNSFVADMIHAVSNGTL